MTMNTTDSATVTTQTDDVETCRIGANATSGPPKTIETKPRCSKNLWIFLVTIAVSFVAGSIVTMVLVLPENRSSSQTTKDDAATETNPTTSQEGTTTTTGPTTTTTTIGDPNSPPYWDIRYKYIANENDNDVGGTQCVVDPNDPHCILSHDTAYYGTTKSYSNGDVFCNFKVLQDGYSLKMDLFDTGKYKIQF